MSNRKLNKLEKELQELDKALAYIIKETPDINAKIYQGKNGKKLYQKDLKAAELKFIQSNGGKFSNNKWIRSAFATKTTWRGALRTAPISTALGDLLIDSSREGIGADGFSTVGGHSQGKPGLIQARKMLQKKQEQVINLLGKSEWTNKDVIPIELRQDLGIARGSSIFGKRSNEYYNREFDHDYIKARQETAGTTRGGLFGGRRKLNTANFANYDSSNYGDKYRFGIRTDHFPSKTITPDSSDGTGGAVNKTTSSTGGYQEGDLTPPEVTFGSQQFVGRGTDVLMPDGGSTSLSIARRDFGRYKKGDMLSGMTRSERRRYNREVLNIGS
jgi:bifunctional DNA-binding transcriptional regulator/antitoxin component of YhaV-PrlF toxin-antitoxin module